MAKEKKPARGKHARPDDIDPKQTNIEQVEKIITGLIETPG